MIYHHEARGTDKAITSAMLTSIPSAGEKENGDDGLGDAGTGTMITASAPGPSPAHPDS